MENSYLNGYEPFVPKGRLVNNYILRLVKKRKNSHGLNETFITL
jgi:hypothetical protein